ncbi:MAG: hypothetical protein WBA10_14595 [Elainellaceae cyanobacterium]
MTSNQYEQLLTAYSDRQKLIDLLRQFRPYLELLPSLRRPQESVISIPLPLIRLREAVPVSSQAAGRFVAGDLVHLPCDIGVVMCDPEWKIKTGVDIFVFINRPKEDFSGLLNRWRQTQVWTDRGYDWLMPTRYQHIFGEGASHIYPLFVLTDDAPDHILQGLRGAALPLIDLSVRRSTRSVSSAEDNAGTQNYPDDVPDAPSGD